MSRMSTNYREIKDFDYLDADDLFAIESHSRILSLDECFQLLCVDTEEVSKTDLAYAQKVHKRGRMKGLTDAATKLFSNMSNRNGTQACLEYLKVHADAFILEGAHDPTVAGGFSFTVISAPPTPKPEHDPNANANANASLPSTAPGVQQSA